MNTTKTAQFTPGPWIIRTHQNLTAICTPKGEMQLSLHGVHDGLKPLSVSLQEWLANAHLIAAAPAMYEALKALVDVFPSVVKMTPYGVSMDISKLHDNAKAVLSQAEGR